MGCPSVSLAPCERHGQKTEWRGGLLTEESHADLLGSPVSGREVRGSEAAQTHLPQLPEGRTQRRQQTAGSPLDAAARGFLESCLLICLDIVGHREESWYRRTRGGVDIQAIAWVSGVAASGAVGSYPMHLCQVEAPGQQAFFQVWPVQSQWEQAP